MKARFQFYEKSTLLDRMNTGPFVFDKAIGCTVAHPERTRIDIYILISRT